VEEAARAEEEESVSSATCLMYRGPWKLPTLPATLVNRAHRAWERDYP